MRFRNALICLLAFTTGLIIGWLLCLGKHHKTLEEYQQNELRQSQELSELQKESRAIEERLRTIDFYIQLDKRQTQNIFDWNKRAIGKVGEKD